MLLERIRLNKRLIFYIVSAGQFVWGLILLSSSEPFRTTGISTIAYFLQSFKLTGLWFVVASILGLISTIMQFRRNINFWLFLPQFFLLLVSTIGAIVYICLGHFADGTVRNSRFILLDQTWLIGISVAYTISLVNNYMLKKSYV